MLLKEGLGVNSLLERLPLSECRVTVSHWVWDHRHLGPFSPWWRLIALIPGACSWELLPVSILPFQ